MYSKVIKLGGSSQTNIGYINLVNYLDLNRKTIVVVSAIKGVTNSLIELTKLIKQNKLDDNFIDSKIISPNNELIKSLGIKDNSFLEDEYKYLYLKINKSEFNLQDEIDLICMGETFTSRILLKFIQMKNLNAKFLDASKVLYSKQKNKYLFNSSKFEVNVEILEKNLIDSNLLIIPGFRGCDKDNNISIMSRGGSDTTGSLIASYLNFDEYQIWTDVNGLYSADPRLIKESQIIKYISYDAAQEVAAMGAEILHPFSIKPCKEKGIPIIIKNTLDLNNGNTIIKPSLSMSENSIYSLTNQENVTVIKIESLDMWNNYGFVFDIFSKFKNLNIDVNIINTSQFDITTTTQEISTEKLNNLKSILEDKYSVYITPNCNLISIVGENIKKYNKISSIMKVIQSFDIKLTSYSSNDMTLSFVVEKKDSINMINNLHKTIFPFEEFTIERNIWWENLLIKEGPQKCKYLYNFDTIDSKINILKKLSSVDKIYYAMKANNNSDILNKINKSGLGFETVTLDEILFLKSLFNDQKVNILYTPNFAKIEDFEYVFNMETNFNIDVIVDNISLIIHFPQVFKDKEIGLRLDLNYGFGHCKKVITQGQESKFGMTPNDILECVPLFTQFNIKIIGLHSHMGSGIDDYKHWVNNLKMLIDVFENIPIEINDIKWLDIGGGFGINENINFEMLDSEINLLKKNYNFQVFIEPGRFIVAESGIIWGRVTQTKFKNNTKFIGTNIGMTDLMRPVLYSSVHPIYFNNDSSDYELATIVGPICESGDVLIKNLKVPNNIKPNDSVILTNSGAYGIVMASNYNNRELPEQIILK